MYALCVCVCVMLWYTRTKHIHTQPHHTHTHLHVRIMYLILHKRLSRARTGCLTDWHWPVCPKYRNEISHSQISTPINGWHTIARDRCVSFRSLQRMIWIRHPPQRETRAKNFSATETISCMFPTFFCPALFVLLRPRVKCASEPLNRGAFKPAERADSRPTKS